MKTKKSHQAELDLKTNEIETLKSSHDEKLITERTEMNAQIANLEQTINNLERNINSEKSELTNKVNLLADEKEKLGLKLMEINEKFQTANSQISIYEAKMKETQQTNNSYFESQLNETKEKLSQRELTMKDLMSKLQATQNEFNNCKQELVEKHNTEIANLKNVYQANEEKNLVEQEARFNAIENEYNSKLSEMTKKFETRLEESNKKIAELSTRSEHNKQLWAQEKSKMDDAFQNNFEQLEKRFEKDYSTFMQTHKV